VALAAISGCLLLAPIVRRRTRSSSSRTPRLQALATLDAVLFDVDGTLIDSNAAHADTWAQALTEHGVPCDAATVRPLVGMGSDKFLPRIAGVGEGSVRGRALAKRKKALFNERLPHLKPMPGARSLLAHLRAAGKDVVVATSADDQEMEALLRQAGVADLIVRRTSKDDAARSKPDPDIVRAALRRAGCRPSHAVMIGDTPYDIEAAQRAGLASIALRCGGYWGDADLAGASAILDDPSGLLQYWGVDR
jgi:HAD superfamily hydrolase (TIGR01509 family)